MTACDLGSILSFLLYVAQSLREAGQAIHEYNVPGYTDVLAIFFSGIAGALGSVVAALAPSSTSVLVSYSSGVVVLICSPFGWCIVLRVKFVDFLEATM